MLLPKRRCAFATHFLPASRPTPARWTRWSPTITAYQAEPGAIVLEVPGRPANTPLHASYRVIPTLAGTLHAQASTIEAVNRAGVSYHLPPVAWAVN
jgi:hypothetical protein